MKLEKQELLGLKEMISKSSKKTIEKYKEANKSIPEKSVIFTGDSMIEYLDVNTLLPDLRGLNRGVAGATTQLMLDAFDEILGNLNPTDLFVSIGSNDLILLESTIDEIVESVGKVFKKISEKFPDTTIYYLSTTPVLNETHKLYKKIYIAGRTNAQNMEINNGVKKLCDKYHVIFINQFDGLIDETGYLNETFTADGIHLNKNGYQVYAGVIREVLQKKITK